MRLFLYLHVAVYMLIAGESYSYASEPNDQPVELPQEYIIAIAPNNLGEGTTANTIKESPEAKLAAQERPTAIAGTGNYTVIAGLFGSSAGNKSYVRFPNGNSFPSTTFITIVGTPTGRNYGTVTVNSPGLSSPQYAVDEILALANVSVPASGDSSFSFYLTNPNYLTGFQHVIYNSINKFFENVSVCTYYSTLDYTPLNSAVVNVHTSRLSSYPSIVLLHNKNAYQTTYVLQMTDARTGASLGYRSISTAANATYGLPTSYLEGLFSFSPSPTQLHVNLLVGGAESAVFGHYVINEEFNAYLNMTQICSIND